MVILLGQVPTENILKIGVLKKLVPCSACVRNSYKILANQFDFADVILNFGRVTKIQTVFSSNN